MISVRCCITWNNYETVIILSNPRGDNHLKLRLTVTFVTVNSDSWLKLSVLSREQRSSQVWVWLAWEIPASFWWFSNGIMLLGNTQPTGLFLLVLEYTPFTFTGWEGRAAPVIDQKRWGNSQITLQSLSKKKKAPTLPKNTVRGCEQKLAL